MREKKNVCYIRKVHRKRKKKNVCYIRKVHRERERKRKMCVTYVKYIERE